MANIMQLFNTDTGKICAVVKCERANCKGDTIQSYTDYKLALADGWKLDEGPIKWSCPECVKNIVKKEIIWQSTEIKPPQGEPILLWSPKWIDEDFCPTGIRNGHYHDDLGFISCGWDACNDQFITIEHDEILPKMWAAFVAPV